MERPIYLDYNATTPIDPQVTEAMLPYLNEKFGNASSSSHAYGWEAAQAVTEARKKVAELIGAKPSDIYFTSGATESNNLALQGIILPLLLKGQKPHLITSLVEHKAVLDVAKALEAYGAKVTYLKPNKEGLITSKQVEEALTPNTVLVSIIYGQNEIGTINPIGEISEVLKAKASDQKIIFHTDAAQVVGKHAVDVNDLGVDLLSASGQKIYGPKGIGYLYSNQRARDELTPLFWGGSQESTLRPGTLNVPGIVGLGKACELCQNALTEEELRLKKLQTKLIDKVLALDPENIILNGSKTCRICTNVNISFKNLSSDLFALGLSGLAVSSSSACSGGGPSHILEALGHDDNLMKSSLRLGIGRFTTEQDIDTAISKIKGLLEYNRKLKESI